MATQVGGARNAERRFYVGMALFMILVVVIGFAPSFYLRGLVYSPRPNPTLNPLVLLHGIAFSIWMLLFLAQAALVSAGRRDTHMALGAAGMLFAAALIPLMYLTAVGQVARATQPPFTTPLAWTAIPLFPIPGFAILIWQGWKNRRNAQAHKRLMLCAALMMMDPAIGRLPILPPSFAAQCILNLIAWLTLVPLFIWDRRTLGRLHWATRTGAAIFAVVLSLRMVALASPAWAAFAARLPGI